MRENIAALLRDTSILVVEDNSIDARIVEYAFKSDPVCGEKIFLVDTLSGARDFILNNNVHCIILDLNLPDSRGEETLNAIRNCASKVPVIVLTASDDDFLLTHALREGIEDYLVKGKYDIGLLKKTVRETTDLFLRHFSIKESEDLLNALTGNKEFLFFLVDSFGKITKLDSSSDGPVLPKEIFELINPDERSSFKISFEELTRGKINRFNVDIISGILHLTLICSQTGFPQGILGFIKESSLLNNMYYRKNISVSSGIDSVGVEKRTVSEEVVSLNEELRAKYDEKNLELVLANKELETFCQAISHDLRSPARRINCFSQILLEESKSSLTKEAVEYLNCISETSTRMLELIDDLMKLSGLMAEEMRHGSVNLSKLVEDVSRDYLCNCPERQVELIIAPDIVTVGDERLLKIVIENLLSNAFKFSSKVNPAKIEFGKHESFWQTCFFISDNGAGFDMEHADRLFVPFGRLHSPEEFTGTGIGLVTIQRIIRRHGGIIWAESKPGKGATFFFTLQEE
ncbi:MAG: response regulator [Candidatus Riflebacteria bacterium]|nr:response regulator [Candidatus Riflebacteria bacterium]